jgi:hypothetical protein
MPEVVYRYLGQIGTLQERFDGVVGQVDYMHLRVADCGEHKVEVLRQGADLVSLLSLGALASHRLYPAHEPSVELGALVSGGACREVVLGDALSRGDLLERLN